MAKALFGDESIQAAPAPAPVSFAPIQQSTSMVPSNTALTAQTVQIVDISRMSAADQTAAQNIARNINLEDTNAIVQFGMGAQVKIGGFADTVLNQVRNKNSGYVGEVMGGLMNHIKSVDVGGLNANAGPLSKIFGGLKARFVGFMNRYEKLSTQIDITVKELEKARTNLMQDIQMLDNLFKQNVQYLGELDVFIAAGQMKLEQARTEILPQLMATAERTNDPLDAQKLQDFNQMLVRFEKKLYDMKLSRMISIQTGPQLRLIQSNNQTLVEKIQSSVVNTIPLWKNQIIIAISLFRQKGALELQKKVTDTTNDLLMKNSEMLKQGSIDIARESERGIVDIETLNKVNNDLITTIDETLKIQQEGKAARAAAEIELVKMESELKAKLKTISSK